MKHVYNAVAMAFFGVVFTMNAIAAGSDRIPPEVMVSYQERKAIYQDWKKDLDQLARESREGLLLQVQRFLGRGVTMAVPEAGQSFRYIDPKPGHVTTVLVLLPEDAKKSPFWDGMYNAKGIAANFNHHMNLLVLRAKGNREAAPRVRGIMLGHEGFHAYIASTRKSQDQTNEEFCGEEAVAHRMEIEVMRPIAPEFNQAVEREALKMEAMAKASPNGRMPSFSMPLDMAVLDKTFGASKSQLDTNYRGTLFMHAVIFEGARKYHKGDGEQAMQHLAEYLCSSYRRNGILR